MQLPPSPHAGEINCSLTSISMRSTGCSSRENVTLDDNNALTNYKETLICRSLHSKQLGPLFWWLCTNVLCFFVFFCTLKTDGKTWLQFWVISDPMHKRLNNYRCANRLFSEWAQITCLLWCTAIGGSDSLGWKSCQRSEKYCENYKHKHPDMICCSSLTLPCIALPWSVLNGIDWSPKKETQHLSMPLVHRIFHHTSFVHVLLLSAFV